MFCTFGSLLLCTRFCFASRAACVKGNGYVKEQFGPPRPPKPTVRRRSRIPCSLCEPRGFGRRPQHLQPVPCGRACRSAWRMRFSSALIFGTPWKYDEKVVVFDGRSRCIRDILPAIIVIVLYKFVRELLRPVPLTPPSEQTVTPQTRTSSPYETPCSHTPPAQSRVRPFTRTLILRHHPR